MPWSSDIQCDGLSTVRNIHAGRTAFVVGAGYSANDFDFGSIGDGVVFACNAAVTILDRCDYFCMTDGAVPSSNFFRHGLAITDRVVFAGGRNFIVFPPVIAMYDEIAPKSLFFDRRYKNSSDLSFDRDDGLLIDGTDVVHVASHLAHVTGCSPIVLVGVDLNYRSGRKYCAGTSFTDGVKWFSLNGSEQKFPETTMPDGCDDHNLNVSLATWGNIKSANPGVKFMNANPAGKLSSLFEAYEKK